MSKFLITAQGAPFDTIEKANEVAKEAGKRGPVYVCQVIGIWRPVTEPVEFVAVEGSPVVSSRLNVDAVVAELREVGKPATEAAEVQDVDPKASTSSPVSPAPPAAPQSEPSSPSQEPGEKPTNSPKRGRPPKNQPNQIQTRDEAKPVIGDHNPFADLTETQEQPEKSSTVLIIDPETGGMAQGEWKCPDCGAACFASQRQCACGTKRVMTELVVSDVTTTASGPLVAAMETTSQSPDDSAQGRPAPQGVEDTAAALKAKERAEALAILAHRVGNDDDECRRCRGPVAGALVCGWKVMICLKDGCHASKETLATYTNLYGDPLANEPELPKFSPAAEGKTKGGDSNLQPEAEPNAAGEIPDEDEIEISTIYLGRRIETPPAEWEDEPITDEGGEGGGGQLKALNTALTEIGYGGDLRHRACVGILGQIRELGSLKELSKAEAHILLSWLQAAGPEDIAELAKVAGPQKVRI